MHINYNTEVGNSASTECRVPKHLLFHLCVSRGIAGYCGGARDVVADVPDV
jgi:hypothetical protein